VLQLSLKSAGFRGTWLHDQAVSLLEYLGAPSEERSAEVDEGTMLDLHLFGTVGSMLFRLRGCQITSHKTSGSLTFLACLASYLAASKGEAPGVRDGRRISSRRIWKSLRDFSEP
jgi:hypothetical protein